MQSSQSSSEGSSDEIDDVAKSLPIHANSKAFLVFLTRVLARVQHKTKANLDLKTQENKLIKSDLRNAIKRYEYLSLSLNKEITMLKMDLKEMTAIAEERVSKIEFLENRNSQMSNKLNEITREYAFMKEAELLF